MSAEPVIDVREFAKSGARLAGTVPAARLARLVGLLFEDGASVDYGISGRLDGDGNPRVKIGVSGRLTMRCQRCLGPVVQIIEARRELRFLSAATQLPDVADEDADVDDVLTPPAMRVLEWVEEEILLGLPIAPRHEEGGCLAPVNPAAEPDATVNRFATLAGLKSSNTKDQ
jgi:DUF177 domain-containing protein